MARPFKDDKKTPVCIKLPPYLIDWMDRQPQSRAQLIEIALNSYYQIPVHVSNIKPLKQIKKSTLKVYSHD